MAETLNACKSVDIWKNTAMLAKYFDLLTFTRSKLGNLWVLSQIEAGQCQGSPQNKAPLYSKLCPKEEF